MFTKYLWYAVAAVISYLVLFSLYQQSTIEKQDIAISNAKKKEMVAPINTGANTIASEAKGAISEIDKRQEINISNDFGIRTIIFE